MKATTFITLAAAGFAAAQTIDSLSPCMQKCISEVLTQVGCTGSQQELARCACKSDVQVKMATPLQKCMETAKCDSGELAKATRVSATQCKALALAEGGGAQAGNSSVPAGENVGSSNSSSSTGSGGLPSKGSNETTSGPGTPTTNNNSTKGHTALPTSTNAAAVMGPAAGALVALFAAAIAL